MHLSASWLSGQPPSLELSACFSAKQSRTKQKQKLERAEIIFEGIFQRRRGEITRFVGSAVLDLTNDATPVSNSNFTGT